MKNTISLHLLATPPVRSSLLRENWGQSLGRAGGERDLRSRGYFFHFCDTVVCGLGEEEIFMISFFFP